VSTGSFGVNPFLTDLEAERAHQDQTLRQALARGDHHTALQRLERTCAAAVHGLHGPGLDDDDLLQAARIGALRALQNFDRDSHHRKGIVAHVIGYVIVAARNSGISMVRAAHAECRRMPDDHPISLTPERKPTSSGRGKLLSTEELIGGDEGGNHVPGVRFNEPHDKAEHAETLAWLAEAIGTLPARQAQAVRLVAINGMTHEQAAARLGIAPKSVRQALWRARDTLNEAREREEREAA
jgi:RNA polymerase sigma factor (sigma-70 family)